MPKLFHKIGLLALLSACANQKLREQVDNLEKQIADMKDTEDSDSSGNMEEDSRDDTDTGWWYEDYPEYEYAPGIWILEVFYNSYPSDEQYAKYDWFELYNREDYAVDLTGWSVEYVADGAQDEPYSISLDGITIEPKEYKAVLVKPKEAGFVLYAKGELTIVPHPKYDGSGISMEWIAEDWMLDNDIFFSELYKQPTYSSCPALPSPNAENIGEPVDCSSISDEATRGFCENIVPADCYQVW